VGCSSLSQGHIPWDAMGDREHGWDHAATAGKRWGLFTLASSSRPHPGEPCATPALSGVTVGRDRHFLFQKENPMSSLHENAITVVEIAEDMAGDAAKAVAGNKSASARVRKACMQLRVMCKDLRKQSLELDKQG
jgi:hypothetical protein